MSNFSESWHTMDPTVRDFYRNFANRYTRFCTPWGVADEYGFKEYFTTFGSSFNAPLGFNVATRNFNAQIFALGSYQKDRTIIVVPSFGWTENPQPIFDWGGASGFPEQFSTIPQFCFNYPRPKVKARRSYWTGAPRRRRNLS